MTTSAVAITGIAMCNALGSDKSQVANSLRAGKSGLGSCPIALPFETVVGAVSASLPALPAELSSWTTRTNQIAALLLVQLEAELARVRQRYDAHRIGVFLGTSTAGADVTENAYRQYLHQGALPEEFDLFKHHTYGSILHVVRQLSGAHGPGWVISTACTSSAKPLATAQRLFAADVIDAAIVGGIDTLCAMTLRGFHSLEALSATAARPFCKDRNGLNIGEGGAFLVLEKNGNALAWLKGVGESSDAYHISAPHPQGLGAKLAMTQALAQAQCEPSDVQHINAHGTGTRLNDIAEAKAIEELFGTDVPVVSTKSYTGHMLGAAGATEAAFATMAIEQGWAPACLGAAPIDENIHIHVAMDNVTGPFQHVLSNCFAFGGNNVSVLVGAAP